MTRVALIHNPRTRRSLHDARLGPDLRSILGTDGLFAEPADLEELDAVMQRFRGAGIGLIFVNGGDGTLQRCVTAAVQAWGPDALPRMGLLRGGTMNTIARGLGIFGRPRRLLGTWMEAIRRGEDPAHWSTCRRMLMNVDGEHYGFLFGNGVVSNYLELYYEGSEPSPAKAAFLLVRLIISTLVGGELSRRATRRFEGKVYVDGSAELPTTDWLAIGAGTVDCVGFRFRPFFRAIEEPGQIHLTAYSCGPLAMIPELLRIWRARPILGTGNHETACGGFDLVSEQSITYMMDGDFYRGGHRVRVTQGPWVEFILP